MISKILSLILFFGLIFLTAVVLKGPRRAAGVFFKGSVEQAKNPTKGGAIEDRGAPPLGGAASTRAPWLREVRSMINEIFRRTGGGVLHGRPPGLPTSKTFSSGEAWGGSEGRRIRRSPSPQDHAPLTPRTGVRDPEGILENQDQRPRAGRQLSAACFTRLRPRAIYGRRPSGGDGVSKRKGLRRIRPRGAHPNHGLFLGPTKQTFHHFSLALQTERAWPWAS